MDALVEHQAAVDGVLAGLLRPMVDQDLSMVFYDLTTIRAEGLTSLPKDVRKFGMSKEGLIARQFMLGIVQTADGLPIYHQVFEGNTAEAPTLLPTVDQVLSRFPSIRRLILVADRGLLSLDNIERLQGVKLKSGEPLEFIIAVPGRRYNEFSSLLNGFHESHCQGAADQESVGELAWQDLRLVVAHDPLRADAQKQARDQQIQELIAQGEQWAGKLDSQDLGQKHKGRKLSDAGATARFYHAVAEARLSKIIQVDLKAKTFSYAMNDAALTQAERMDGKLLLVTNTQDLKPKEVIHRYKSLADIERGFRVLKSELEIGPVYHRLPDRIRAHTTLCFIALILYRVMRMRLNAADAKISPDRALETLRRIQHHQIRLNQAAPVTGLSTISPEQADLFKALNVKKPTST
jgi:transposase